VLPSREKEQEMKNIVRIIGVSLAAMAGILLVSGVAWAQASKEMVSGRVINFRVIDNGKMWLDDDEVRHFRNRKTRLQMIDDIWGVMHRFAALNINRLTREADGHGSFTFVGSVGENQDLVRATGRFTFLCTGTPSLCEEHQNWHLDDGRKVNLTERFPLDSNDFDVYEGTVLDPPGH
jgi:hypothetical protein